MKDELYTRAKQAYIKVKNNPDKYKWFKPDYLHSLIISVHCEYNLSKKERESLEKICKILEK